LAFHLHPGVTAVVSTDQAISLTPLVALGAGIAQGYSAELRIEWSGIPVPAGAGNFSFHHHIQTGSGAYLTSYPIRNTDSFPGGEAAEAWSWPLTSI